MKNSISKIIPKSKFLSVCLSFFLTFLLMVVLLLFSLYLHSFLSIEITSEKITPLYLFIYKYEYIYSYCICFGFPLSIGLITTLTTGYYKQQSFGMSTLYAQLVLLLFMAVFLFKFGVNNYSVGFLIMYSPFLIIFIAIGAGLGFLIQKSKYKNLNKNETSDD